MSKHNKLEVYLIKLERSLGSIPISEKAEIITEIKSHIMDASENNSDAKIEDILKSLGEPEQVANKYLLERGLSPQKPPRHPIVKWLVIGFLGTFAISAVMTIIIMFKFSPLVEVDEKKGTVKILGGLIDVQESKGGISVDGVDLKGVTFGGMSLEGMNFGEMNLKHSIDGSYELKGQRVDELIVELVNTKLFVENTDADQINYDCTVGSKKGASPGATITKEGKVLKFMISNSNTTKCELSVPKKINIDIKAVNGKFEFDELANNVRLKAANGKIEFSPDMNLKYAYDLKVTNGKIDSFISSDDKDAYKVELKLINGKISK